MGKKKTSSRGAGREKKKILKDISLKRGGEGGAFYKWGIGFLPPEEGKIIGLFLPAKNKKKST